MSSQYSFAPYQDPPDDIPAHEREQAAYSQAAKHYSSQEGNPASDTNAFLPPQPDTDDRINQYETGLPLRYSPLLLYIADGGLDWILKLLLRMLFRPSQALRSSSWNTIIPTSVSMHGNPP